MRWWSPSRLPLFAAALLGCPAPSPVGPIASGSGTASLPDATAVEVAAIEPLRSMGCELAGAEPVGPRALSIFTAPEAIPAGTAMLRARFETATFTMPQSADADGAGWVEALGWGVSVAGLVRLRDVPVWVRPSRKLLDGMLTPGPSMIVSVVRVSGRAVTVRIAKHALLGPAALPFDVDVACDDLVAAPPPALGRSIGKDVELDGRELALRGTADPSEAVALLPIVASQGKDRNVIGAIEIERSGKMVRVEIPSSDGAISGWIAASSVRPGPSPSPASTPSVPRPAPPPLASDTKTCTSDVRFAVEDASAHRLFWLGSIRKGTPFSIESRKAPEGWTSIRASAIDKGDLVVRADAIVDCNAAAP